MRTSPLCVVVLIALAVGCGPAEEAATGPPFMPVADVMHLMQNIVDPAADVVWGSVGTIIDDTGTNEFFPQNDEEWQLIVNAAMTLTESGNLLMIGERAIDDGLWMEMSQDLVKAGQLALAAAQAQDKDEIFMIGGEVYAACDQCHATFWVGDLERGLAFEDAPSQK
ncbi:MAG: hypothetical protein VYE73_15855 [Acidobacteriota bacterium]|nr:hypothetical protein [Acidobacteriota bacterium]